MIGTSRLVNTAITVVIWLLNRREVVRKSPLKAGAIWIKNGRPLI